MFRHICALFLVFLLALPLRAQPFDRELAQAHRAWKTDDFAGAEAHFDRALRGAGNHHDEQAQALYGRGVVRLEQHKWQGAADDLTRCLAIEPRNADAYMARGMARKGLGDYSGLLADAHQAARLDPEWKGFEDDAKSTVLWRRAMLGFLVLGGLVVCVGAVPLLRGLVRLSRLEKAARQAPK